MLAAVLASRWRAHPVMSTIAEPLGSADTDALVAERSRLRGLRDYTAADAIKERLEAAGIRLQDEVGGTTRWELEEPQLTGDLEVGRLAKASVCRAAEGDTAAVAALVADAEARCAADGVVLLGRSAADAAFDFGLAGDTGGLIATLATLQAAEFSRWRRAQPLATLQVCERLAAAGVPPDHRVFRDGAAALRAAAAREPDAALRQRAFAAAARVEQTAYSQNRPLLWLWRRAARLRKPAAPAAAASRRALGRVHFAQPARPLVLDLGCGWGCSLLGLCAAARQGAGAGAALAAGAPNLLGCDASPLKVAYARGIAARWGARGGAAFAVASAEATMAHALAADAPVAGVLLQFPSPFRVGGGEGEGGGNAQLPAAADDDSYMVSAALLGSVAAALRPTRGWLLLQSNVEDVALHARALAEAHGLRACATQAEVDAARRSAGLGPWRGAPLDGGGAAGAPPPRASGPSRRRDRLLLELGPDAEAPRAAGRGWLRANPLGVLSETEAKLELEGREVFRCLLRPSA